MNECRYYMDPRFGDMIWRFGNTTRGEAKLKGQDWIFSACDEFYNFVEEGIEPLEQIPDWV